MTSIIREEAYTQVQTKKKDVLHIVQQFFNYLTNKTMVSFAWSIALFKEYVWEKFKFQWDGFTNSYHGKFKCRYTIISAY